MDKVSEVVSAFSGILWGWPLIILLLGTHIFLTIKLKFPQRHIFHAIGLYFSKERGEEGEISPFNALMLALAANIGAGNIIGVGVAVYMGGPGAIFWCWLTGVLGMATRYGEGYLSIAYRTQNKAGEYVGGPMYVLELGLKQRWLGVVFAVFTAIAAFGIGNLTQAHSAADALHATWSVEPWISGIAMSVLVGVVMLGGIRSIGKLCGRLVPLMGLLYIVGCFIILTLQWEHVLPAISLIVQQAFTNDAMIGGTVGGGLLVALRSGVARGLFSNEAGMGSAPIASAAARGKDPARQALIASTGPFWDTVVICALTGLVVATSVAAHPDISYADGQRLVSSAFAKLPLCGEEFLTISLLTFVVSTLLGWSYFGEKALEYLGGSKLITPYRVLWVILIYVGATSKVQVVWDFADCANGLMAIPNLVSLLLLSGVIALGSKKYFERNSK